MSARVPDYTTEPLERKAQLREVLRGRQALVLVFGTERRYAVLSGVEGDEHDPAEITYWRT